MANIEKNRPSPAETLKLKFLKTAVEELQSEAYQQIFKKLGFTLQSPDFYLKGGIKTDNIGVLPKINQTFRLELSAVDVAYSGSDKGAREIAVKNNMLVGILRWHLEEMGKPTKEQIAAGKILEQYKKKFTTFKKDITATSQIAQKELSNIASKITDTARNLVRGHDPLNDLPEGMKSRREFAEKRIQEALDFLKDRSFSPHSFNLKSAAFYLSIAVKESSLDPTEVSDSDAKGLFQLKNTAVDEVIKFFPDIGLTRGSIYSNSTDPSLQESASKNNAIAGILYWHIGRDYYGAKINSDLSDKDKDKLGNMIYKMGPTMIKKLWNAVGAKSFQEFATIIAQKIEEKYPDETEVPEGKLETILSKTYNINFTSYIKVKSDLPDNELEIDGSTFDTANTIQSLRYAELIASMMHGSAREKSEKITKPHDHYLVGKNGKWFWGIAKEIYENLMIDQFVPYFMFSGKKKAEKIDMFMKLIVAYNKEIKKNPDFADNNGSDTNLKKGTRVYVPTAEFIFDFISKQTPADSVKKNPEEKGPAYHLDGSKLTVDFKPPVTFTINTSLVAEKVLLDGKNGYIEVKIGNLVGVFKLENGKSLSYGPLDKDSLWGSYDLHFDPYQRAILIIKKELIPEKLAPPEVTEKVKAKDYLDPDQPLDLSWPEGEKYRVPKIGEIIYIGKDGKKLKAEGEKLHSPAAVAEPKYATPDWLDPNKGKSKGDKSWDLMPTIKGVILHATEGTQNDDAELFKKQNTHFLVKRNGDIWMVRNPKYQTNHTGYFDSSYGAIWDGNEYPYKDQIGIEVETYAFAEMIGKGLLSFPVRPDAKGELNVHLYNKNGRKFYYTTNEPKQNDLNKAWELAGKYRSYTKEEYAALKGLLHNLAFQNKLKKQDIITHSMVGSGIYGRGRKTDPCNLDFAKLDLPNNYRQIDPDVARGTLPSQIVRVEGERKGTHMDREKVDGDLVYKVYKKGDEYHYLPSSGFGGQSFMNSGLKAAQELCADHDNCKPEVNPAHVKLNDSNAKVDSNMTVYEAIKHNVSPDCPVEIINEQTLVDVLYYSFDNQLHKGQIVVHKKLVKDIQEVFALAMELKFPISTVVPVSSPKYNWSDLKSVEQNNTSAFNYRAMEGSTSLSNHALGQAIDINPRLNPYIDSSGKSIPAKATYNPQVAGTLTATHPIVKKFKALGWQWGGDWKKTKDYQHFEKKL